MKQTVVNRNALKRSDIAKQNDYLFSLQSIKASFSYDFNQPIIFADLILTLPDAD